MIKENYFDVLPDGSTFEFWDLDTEFKKTYHVAHGNLAASDENPGTQECPFLTIDRAAELLQPGERVLIHDGIYREFVRPKRGGLDAQHMISYEAAPGEKVIISGAEVWNTEWKISKDWRWYNSSESPKEISKAKIWVGDLPISVFKGINPFSMVNSSSQPWIGATYFFQNLASESKFEEFMQRRGLMFIDGTPLVQVTYYYQLNERAGTYWVEDNGMKIHFRLSDDESPYEHLLEFTAREQVFSPSELFTSFIRVKGITFECVGNGFPCTQHGALSSYCGHHWIIEDNVVRMANSIGIDIGQENPYRVCKELAGLHIVRGNTVSDCGICGLCGVPSDDGFMSVLIENNRFERNGWHNVEFLFEQGSIKIHLARGCLIRNNVIIDTIHGPGIWVDFWNINTRVCGNLIMNCKSAMMGALFIEASHEVNMVDDNVIWGVNVDENSQKGGNGIYEHDCDRITVRNNLICKVKGAAVQFSFGCTERIVDGRGATGRKHRIENNIVDDCGLAIALPTRDNFCNGNIYGTLNQPAPFRVEKPEERLNLEAWQEFLGWDLNGKETNIKAELNEETLILNLAVGNGDCVKEKSFDLNKKFNLGEMFE
jgi:hypothetical protein